MTTPGTTAVGLVRRHARKIAAVGLALPLYAAARLPALPAAEREAFASRFRFARTELPDVLPDAVHRDVRRVHPSFERIAGWISVLGAAAALADLDRDGLANDVCWVDTRVDRVLVGPAPGTGERYAPFALDESPLPFDARTSAPMGSVPCDVDEDGWTDLLVYYWGRTPVLFLRDPGASSAASDSGAVSAASWLPVEVSPEQERWYTNAATFADVDGDGHADLVVGNYFPDGARVLDPQADGREEMQDSMSRAYNGGRDRVLVWSGDGSGWTGFREAEGALPERESRAWTLGLGAADLDGDLLPELYVANDFAPDLLLHNRSQRGKVALAPVRGERTWTAPRSKVLGCDSFKGMGVDFCDVDGDGRLDIYVSNITTEYGLEESQFLWVCEGDPARMAEGVAPFADRSEELGLSRSGWGWDVRLADLDNDGRPEALQALGFLRGTTNRWPELHEAAMGNDQLLRDPRAWHRFLPGDDLSGSQPNAFFVRGRDGRYHDLARDVGFERPENTRGIALGDVDGDGDLDLVCANQWRASSFYANEGPANGAFLGLHLLLPLGGAEETEIRPGHPPKDLDARRAVTAQATVRLPVGRRLVAQVDNGNGHSGKRSQDLLFGLGAVSGVTLAVEIAWRDARGDVRRETFELAPGWHTVLLAGGRS